MLELVVEQGTDKGKRLRLEAGQNIIGRDPTKSNLVISDSKVSKQHAEILVNTNGDIFIGDMGSTNGTFIRGTRIVENLALRHGDRFNIGDTIIRFLDTEKEKTFNNNCVTSGRITHFLGDGGIYSPEAKSERSLQANNAVINIGRDPSNDMVLPHPLVSRHHARLILRGTKYFLFDLNSVNGTYINGHRIKEPHELAANSLIQICGFSFIFDGFSLIEYDDNGGNILIEIQDLNRSVQLKSGKTQNLLTNINLVIKPCEFVAIVGSSGTGKTTLLGALTGMRPASTGEIRMNGRNYYQEYEVFRSLIGYVPQEDIVHLDLTIREVLYYSARLRMPDDTSETEINDLIDNVMKELELSNRADIMVRNLSGGQRKRVSIGVELLTKPSLFFLDEPTSGLDPGLEKNMMQMLGKISRQGRTILVVTHATYNIHLCDKVIFLGEEGRVVFFGTPVEALDYFKVNDFTEIYPKLIDEKSSAQWAADFQENPLYKEHIGNELNETKTASGEGVLTYISALNWANRSFVQQWKILTERYLKLILRDRRNLLLLFTQPIIIALLLVIVFTQSNSLFGYSDFNPDELVITQEVVAEGYLGDVQEKNRQETSRRLNMSICVALMVFSAVWLGTSNSVREIIKELPVYTRERLVNLRISTYLLSKVTVLSGVCLIQMMLFVFILYQGLGLPNPITSLIALFLVALGGVMMGLTTSAIVSNPDKAVSTLPMLIVPQIILSGALVPMHQVSPAYLQAFFYLAISKWGYELLGGGQIVDINNRVSLPTKLIALDGVFIGHWFILFFFVIILFGVSFYSVWKKDGQFN